MTGSAGTASAHEPHVSIGVPVRNGAEYLREALDSLLAQDYPSFDILLSDNASTDATPEICREYAARDPRVRYHRVEQNQGSSWNFNRVFELGTGKYFMWSAHDDLRAPDCVSRCVAALEARPEAVLCTTRVRFIDERGRELPELAEVRNVKPVGATREERVRALARCIGWYDIYGLIRRDVLARTRLSQPIWGPDVILTLELCLLGEVIALPEPLFSYRLFLSKTAEEMAAGIGPADDIGRVTVDWLGMCQELARTIRRAGLTRAEQERLVRVLLWELVARNPNGRASLYADVAAKIRKAVGERNYREVLRLAPLLGALGGLKAWFKLGRLARRRG